MQFVEGKSATDDELAEACKACIAKYKIPKVFIRVDKMVRSPSGKADYRWAKAVATEGTVPAEARRGQGLGARDIRGAAVNSPSVLAGPSALAD